MALDIHQFPCLKDNYAFLARDHATGACAAVDTPDAEAILRELDRLGWRLAMVLNTHWHPDHAGGNAALKAATGCELIGPEEVRRIAPLDRVVGEGDVVSLGETRLSVIGTPGHTLGHIAYYDAADGVAFVGDTLFALGCGRLFEGDAATMWASLSKLAALPGDTRVYCAHEYTADNARFALSLDEAPDVVARCAAVFSARDRDEWTVPTTIALERATNPFLRAPTLAERMGLEGAEAAEAFAAVRAAKDAFR